MIELGKLELTGTAARLRGRRCVREVGIGLGLRAVVATRVATAVSQLSRSLGERTEPVALEVMLGTGQPPALILRGGQPVYSDLAITVCLTLGMVYKQPLRQTEGFVRSLVRLMGLDLCVPDYSTFSRRGAKLILPMKSQD